MQDHEQAFCNLLLIGKRASFYREYGTRMTARLLQWSNSYMTKSRVAFSSSKRVFPEFCVCREQQKPSSVITGITKLSDEEHTQCRQMLQKKGAGFQGGGRLRVASSSECETVSTDLQFPNQIQFLSPLYDKLDHPLCLRQE